MVEEKEGYRFLYEMEIEIHGVDGNRYNYWKENEPSDKNAFA